MKCPVAGCDGAPVVLASNMSQGPSTGAPAPFATDGESVYWSEDGDGKPESSNAASPAAAVKPEVIGAQGAEGLAVFQGTFYWTKFSAELYACPTAGCGSSKVTLWSAGYSPCDVGVAVDASGIYWVADAPDTLFSCPLGGCGGAPTTLMAGSPDVADLQQVALDANNVYFTDGNPAQLGMILACAKSGCGATPTVLASGLDAPIAIATDGINVYWTEKGPDFVAGAPVTGAGLVRKCAVSGCGNAPTNIATGLTAPGALALDDANVYWTEGGTAAGGGKICKAPK